MEIRITFRSELYLSGETLNEIKNKWEALPLYSGEALEEASAEFIETVSVEDSSNHEDLISEWNKL